MKIYWIRMKTIFNRPVVLYCRATHAFTLPAQHRVLGYTYVSRSVCLSTPNPSHIVSRYTFTFYKIARYMMIWQSAVLQQTVQSSRRVPKIRCAGTHAGTICVQSSVNIGCSVGVREAAFSCTCSEKRARVILNFRRRRRRLQCVCVCVFIYAIGK